MRRKLFQFGYHIYLLFLDVEDKLFNFRILIHPARFQVLETIFDLVIPFIFKLIYRVHHYPFQRRTRCFL
ncbi:hypothetical protein A2U01_0094795, partial [Trifolium medium]|nr:hypothetical protein [Trifolium medium]